MMLLLIDDSPLVPKLHLGTYLSRQLSWLDRLQSQAARPAAKLRRQTPFPSATWERGELLLHL